jgi:Rrf2 family protein
MGFMALRISKRSSYALRAVYELASRRTATPVSVADIADAQGIPPRFLESILNELRHAGIVVSQRGNAGGYALIRPPEKITVADVLEATQGPISIAADGNGRTAHKYIPGDAAFDDFWQMVDDSIAQVCRRTSLASLVKLEIVSERTPVPDYTI